MCTGFEIAALAASAAGTGLSVNAQNQAAHDQARELRARTMRSGELNRRAGTRVNEQIQNLKTSNPDADEATAKNNFLTALRTAQVNGSGGLSDAETGNVSDRFRADAQAVHGANAAGNVNAATSAARVDAPFMQRVREGAGASRTASDLSLLENEGRGQDFLSQLRMSMIHPDAGQMAAGQLLGAFGQAAASRAPGVKKPKVFGGLPTQTRTPDTGVNA